MIQTMTNPRITIPCKLCGELTDFLGTQLCNPCWVAERQIEYIAGNPKLRQLMIAAMKQADKAE